VVVLVSALVATGCGGGSGFTSIAPPPHALSPKAPSAVEVADTPPTARNPVEIGRVEASSSTHASTGNGHADALDQLRKEAGAHGCDVIVVGPSKESLAATSAGTPLYRTHETARCFVYR
jgi:hypothetical protein